jgi:sporulation and spore germination protein/immunoglobulin-like protein involved in spore germination
MLARYRMVYAFSLLLSALLVGTSTANADSTAATPTEGTPTAQPATISVYFLRTETRGDKLGAAHRQVDAPTTEAAAKAALHELIQGPTKAERAAGLKTNLPKDIQVRGLVLDEATKLATVDLSTAFVPTGETVAVARLAQIVFTLTQFPTVEHVAIAVAGQPLALLDGDGKPLAGPAARADFERLTPLIFLESPAPGDTIASPVRLWGTANTFEATFTAEIRDAGGKRLVSQIVTATSGNGFRGTFDVSLRFDPDGATVGKVIVYEISAKDGARENEVAVPVKLGT